MQRQTYIGLLLAVFALALSLASVSCSSRGIGGAGQPELFRQTSSYVEAYSSGDGPSMWRVEGPAPCLVGAIVGFYLDYQPGTTNVFSRIEINFGDGSGWEDVTAQQPHWDYYTYDGIDQSGAVLHTYTVPGDYRVRSRVTYWDGEVVESVKANGEEPLVTVTQ